MQPLLKRLEPLQAEIETAYKRLSIIDKETKLAELDSQLADPDVWHNPDNAQTISKQAAALRSTIEPWQTLRAQAHDIAELMELGDDSLAAEFDTQISAMESELARLKKD